MSTRITITGILSGAALGLGLLAAGPSAHATRGPSPATQAEAETRFDCQGTAAGASLQSTGDEGADGGNGPGTQGRSNSDPDGDANGGADKPGCDGGFDDDRDGNNGCGNDGDFEDDNNGRCGPGPATSDGGDDGPEAGDEAADAGEGDGPSAEVAATAAGFDTRPAAGTASAGTAPTGTEPAGTESGATSGEPADGGPSADEPGTEVLGVTEERPDALPRTGAGLGALTAAAGLCLGGGRLAGAVRRLLGS